MSLPKLKKIRVLNEKEMKDFTGGTKPCMFSCSSSCSDSCSTCSPGNTHGKKKEQ